MSKITDKKDVYQKITDQIIKALNQGIKPWESGYGSGLQYPIRSTRQPYRGINVLTLWCESMTKGFSQDMWVTFKQAMTLGGKVKRGEHGSTVVFYKRLERKDETVEEGEKPGSFAFARGFTVFNIEQCEGLPETLFKKPAERTEHERIADAEAFIKSTGAVVVHTSGNELPCYVPSKDIIKMPELELYATREKYYTTIFHEITHWSGATHRLDRMKDRKEGGNKGIAYEELIAELGSAFIAADVGMKLENLDNHISYISGWLEAMKGDKKFIFQAASAAQKAMDYLKPSSIKQVAA